MFSCSVATLGLLSGASAQVLTYGHDFSGSDTFSQGASGSYGVSMPGVPKFDVGRGTLTKVVIKATTDWTDAYRGTATKTGNGTVFADWRGSLSMPAGQRLTYVGNDFESRSFTNGSTYNLSFSSSGGERTLTITDPAILTSFAGSGNLSLIFSGTFNTSETPSSFNGVSNTMKASIRNGRIDYSYTPLPEPSTVLAILGGTLLVIRKRRRR
jgi:hypothetical protein